MANLSVHRLKAIIGSNISDESCQKIIDSASKIANKEQKLSIFKKLFDKIEIFKKQAPIVFLIAICTGIGYLFGAAEKVKGLYDLYLSKDHGIYVNLFRPDSKTGDNNFVSTLIDTSIKSNNIIYMGVKGRKDGVICAQIPITLTAIQASDFIDVDFIFEFEYNKSNNVSNELFDACNTEIYLKKHGSTISFYKRD